MTNHEILAKKGLQQQLESNKTAKSSSRYPGPTSANCVPPDNCLMPMSLKPPMARGSSGVLNSVQNTQAQMPLFASTKSKSKLNSQPLTFSKNAGLSDANKSELQRQQLDKKTASQSKFIKDMISNIQTHSQPGGSSHLEKQSSFNKNSLNTGKTHAYGHASGQFSGTSHAGHQT